MIVHTLSFDAAYGAPGNVSLFHPPCTYLDPRPYHSSQAAWLVPALLAASCRTSNTSPILESERRRAVAARECPRDKERMSVA